MEANHTEAPPRLAALAERLDYFTEHDLTLLADVLPSTLELWRKRGEGPVYARIGRRYMYHRTAVTEWLASRVHERKPTSKAGVL